MFVGIYRIVNWYSKLALHAPFIWEVIQLFNEYVSTLENFSTTINTKTTNGLPDICLNFNTCQYVFLCGSLDFQVGLHV